MSDDDEPLELPADPFGTGSGAGGLLDRARMLRLALVSLDDVGEVFRAVGALTDSECRAVLVELALDAALTRRVNEV